MFVNTSLIIAIVLFFSDAQIPGPRDVHQPAKPEHHVVSLAAARVRGDRHHAAEGPRPARLAALPHTLPRALLPSYSQFQRPRQTRVLLVGCNVRVCCKIKIRNIEEDEYLNEPVLGI